MKIYTSVILCLFLGLQFYGHGQNEVELINNTVGLDDVKAHLTFIASDELNGRETGSNDLNVAAMYLKTQMMSHGILTAPGMDDYFQNVPMAKITPPKMGAISLEGVSLSFPDDFVILGGNDISGSYSSVFASHANLEDTKDLQLKGKMVVAICGDGTTDNAQSWFYQAEEKKKRLKEAGAAGLIEIYQSNKVPYKFLKQQFAREQISLTANEEDEFLHLWVNAADKEEIASLKQNTNLDLNISPPQKETIKSKNVIGFVEGTDPVLKDQYVIYSAHYDHVGTGNPDAEQDSIYNGARDNGVGTTAILEVAEHLAQYPTRRSALFVFFTAEEKGLLGSRYFVENAPVELNDIVYNLNIDNGGYNDTTIVSVVGLDRTTAGEKIQTACNAFGLEAIEDPAKEQGLFDRSDNVNFAKKGIPAPTFSLGFRSFDAEIFKYYHQPGDEVESLNFDYLLKYFRAYVLSAKKIGNADEKPFWVKGDKYYEAGISLYNE